MSLFATIGVIYTLYLLYRFVSFILLYFLKTYPIDEFLTGHPGSPPYAIVTGASDGIGKGIARELYRRGFNLILHGRNSDKLKKVVDEMRTLRGEGDKRDIRIFLADATKGDHDFQNMMAPFRELNVSILVNNVGGSSELLKLDEWPTTRISETLNWNISFPLGLIHVLLPQFRRRHGKCLVVNVGGFGGDHTFPRLAVYCAGKSFLKTLSRTLALDEKYFTPTNVRFLYLNVGEVSTNALRQPVTLSRPHPDTFGKAVVDRMACGRLEVTPYAIHAVLNWFLHALGEFSSERLRAQSMNRHFELEAKEMKKKNK